MTKTDSTNRASTEGKEAWVKPNYACIRAGEAELGANPVIAEGFFAKGS